MTLATTARKVTFTGNGVTTSWPYTFRIDDSDHLSVILTEIATGTESTLSDTLYTVSGIGDSAGGSVEYPLTGSPLASTHKLTIVRTVPYTQTLDIYNQGGFYPETTEQALDQLTMEAQQLAEQSARAVKLPVSSALSDIELPTPIGDGVITWNAAGTALETKTLVTLGSVQVFDEDDMASNSATGVPSQQSTKAYVDAAVASIDLPYINQAIVRGADISDTLWNSRIGDFSSSERGPLFVWNNPSNADLAAGENAGLQIWVGDNPTATPGSGDVVAATIAINNGNDRTGQIWALDAFVQVLDLGTGYADCAARTVELEMFNGFAFSEADPFGSGNRKNGLELVGGHGGGYKNTAALTVWANDTTGAEWWDTGIALSRIATYGIRAIKDPGGATDTGTDFATAFIYDESDSAAVLKIGSGTHTSVIDLTDGPTLTQFILGDDAAATNLLITNSADYNMTLTLDSGSTTAAIAQIAFSDQGTDKWSVKKNTANDFVILNNALAASALTITGSTSAIAMAGDVNIGPGAGDALGFTGTSLSVRASSGNTGIQIGNGASSQFYMITDGANFANVATNGAIPLNFQINNASKMILDASGILNVNTGAAAGTPASFAANNIMTQKLLDGTTIYIPYMTSTW